MKTPKERTQLFEEISRYIYVMKSFILMCVRMCAHAHTYVGASICVSYYIGTYVSMSMHVDRCICIHVYVYMYICTNTSVNLMVDYVIMFILGRVS